MKTSPTSITSLIQHRIHGRKIALSPGMTRAATTAGGALLGGLAARFMTPDEDEDGNSNKNRNTLFGALAGAATGYGAGRYMTPKGRAEEPVKTEEPQDKSKGAHNSNDPYFGSKSPGAQDRTKSIAKDANPAGDKVENPEGGGTTYASRAGGTAVGAGAGAATELGVVTNVNQGFERDVNRRLSEFQKRTGRFAGSPEKESAQRFAKTNEALRATGSNNRRLGNWGVSGRAKIRNSLLNLSPGSHAPRFKTGRGIVPLFASLITAGGFGGYQAGRALDERENFGQNSAFR